VRADVLEWLGATEGEAARQGPADLSRGAPAGPGTDAYDLIYLDAPTFSNSKSMTEDLDIQRDHAALIRAAARLLSPEGILLFSSNLRRFRLDSSLTQAFHVVDITKQTIPPDFARNPRIHTCFRITLGEGSGR
jgi:23S rRNA (guanine2445-N2)-methyltransferase / 23S rRNA (guanine2069-N7)-methyltransferase